jgi:phosphate:Na+ symporter
MEFQVIDIFRLIGSLALFIYGMKVMSDGIQKVAGVGLRNALGAMTRNRFFGVATGFLITGIIQSSSATTVMTVSFVNAGLLTLAESAGVMMGANIGTTITAWFISLLGFKVKIVAIAFPLIAAGLPMMLLRKGNVRLWGEAIIGFALLFIGLDELQNAVPDLKSNPEVLDFLSGFADHGLLSRLAFIGIGTIVTIIVQSSSAAMALTLVLCFNGIISFEVAAAMVLGENIGTTITAELASLVGNVHAKRSARIHSLFNIIGVSWMFFILPVYLQVIDSFMTASGMESPFVNSENIPYALSAFHTAFNFTNVLILIGFSNLLVRLAIFLVPSRGDDQSFSLEYIGQGLLGTPELAVAEASKEVENFSIYTRDSFLALFEMLKNPDDRLFEENLKKIKRIEEACDQLDSEISEYLNKTMEDGVSERTSSRVKSLLEISNYLESITDLLYSSSKGLERKKNTRVYFTPDKRRNIVNLMALVGKGMEVMVDNIKNPRSPQIERAREIEMEINEMRTELRSEYIESVGTEQFKRSNGYFYIDLIQELERLGDHIFSVTESLAKISY